MSNKKVDSTDIALGTRAAKRHLQRRIFREHKQALVARFNKEFAAKEIPVFDHAVERRCTLTSGQRAMRLIAKYKGKKVQQIRYNVQALSHGIRTGKHALTKKYS